MKRIIEMFDIDDSTSLFFETDAPKEEIRNGVCYVKELRGTDSLPSDEEILKEYLENKGYTFSRTEFEVFVW